MKNLFILCALLLSIGAGAQTQLKRQGNVFVEMKDTTFHNDGTKTQFTYKAQDGKTYPIYLSKNGKAYIVRVSKKSGKQYKQYLPEVTKQIAK